MVLLLVLATFVVSTPASAAATYTFYVSGTAVGTTAPGVAKDYTLNLTNLNSTASISFNLSIVASPVGWTSQLSQASLTVGPSGTQQVTLTVQPPSTALADSVGQYVNVTATPDDNTTSQTIATTTRVTEVFGVSVTVIPNAGTSGDPGQNITWLAYVKNTGNSQQTYSVNVNNTSFTSTNLTTNLVTVSPGDTRVITVTINISATAPVGTLYSRMTATSNANSSITDTEDFSATVNAKRAVALSGLTPDDLHASTEAEASVTLRNIIVENRGNVADSYTLQGTANASRHGDWVSFDSTALSLAGFGQRYLNVTVNVPSSITATGDYTVEFRIISDNSTAVIAFLNLTITVTAKHDLKMEYESLVSKQSGEPGTTVSFPINVSNPGAFDQRVDLNYSGPNSAWVTISATPFTLASGAYKIVYYNFSIPGTESPGSFSFQTQGSINWTSPSRNRTVDLTLEVKQIYDVVASTTASAASGLPGTSVSFTVAVRNNGTGTDNFTLSATNTTQAGVLSLSTTTLMLAAGASGNVTVTVAVASSPAPATGVYYYGITAKSSGNVSKQSSVNLALTVNQTYALSATVTPSYQTADPGSTASFTVSVVNNGNGADSVTLQKAGANQTWVSFPTGSGTIAAGARMNFTVQVSAPSWSLAGDTLLTVRAVSGGEANVSSSSSFTISLNSLYAFALTAGASDVPNAHRNNTYTVSVTARNSGNQPDTYTLAVTGPDAGWASLPFADLSLDPNMNATFTVSISVPADPANGAHVFTVTATSLANSSQVRSAAFTVSVNDILRPEVRLTTTAFFGQPNTVLNVPFTVRNNGTIADSYTLTMTAYFPTRQTESRNYTLNPGASATGAFAVNVSHPFTNAYLVEFRLVSLTNSSFEGSAFANITLEVVRRVELTPASTSEPGGPGSVVNFSVMVRNTGNITDTYNMSYDTPPGTSGWTAWFSSDAFTLAPGAATNVTVYVQAASIASENLNGYATTVRVTSATDSASQAAVALRLVVSFDQALTRTPPDASLLPGSSATFAALVENTGTADDTFVLTPTGQIASWVGLLPSIVSLAAGESAAITVTVTVPVGEHEGLKAFSLESRSTKASTEFRQVAFSITVLKVFGFTVSAPPTPVAVLPGQTATFPLTVINTGNANDTYLFVATPPQYIAFAPSSSATIDALQTANVSLRFTPPASASAGTQLIQVTVYGSAGNTQVVFLNATVGQVFNVSARGVPSDTFTGAGAPGSQVQLSFNITNRGNGPDTMTWTLSGEAAAWAQALWGSVVLQGGATTVVNVVVDIPLDPLDALAGSRPLNVTVLSQGGGAAVSAFVAGDVVVSESPAFSLSLDATSSVTSNVTDVDRVSPGTLEYTLYLRNLGNRVETLTISRTPITGWTISILIDGLPGSTLSVNPGEQHTATVRIASFPPSATDDTVRVTARVADGLAPAQDVSITIHFFAADVQIDPPQVLISNVRPIVGEIVSITFTVRNAGSGTATGVQVELVIDGQERVDQETLPALAPGRTIEVTLEWTVLDNHAGKSHTITIEIPGVTAATAEGTVDVPAVQRGFVAKLAGDRDVQLVLIAGLVLGLAIGIGARGGRKKPAARPPAPMRPPPPPPGSPEAALAGLAALEAEAEGPAGAPLGAPPGPQGGAVEHKIVCPNCGTEQWIRGAEGECKSCGVVIEVAEEEMPGPSEGI